MNTLRNIAAAVLAAFAIGTFVPEAVAEARSAADHLAIAAAYETEAADAEARAAMHGKMARGYGVSGAPKGSRSSMVSHCQRLVKHYRAAADDFRALAAEHRRLAGTAGQ